MNERAIATYKLIWTKRFSFHYFLFFLLLTIVNEKRRTWRCCALKGLIIKLLTCLVSTDFFARALASLGKPSSRRS